MGEGRDRRWPVHWSRISSEGGGGVNFKIGLKCNGGFRTYWPVEGHLASCS